MTWPMWVFLGLAIALPVYLVARFAFVYFICGGNNSGSNYYPDPER